jgi:hypothetical protein
VGKNEAPPRLPFTELTSYPERRHEEANIKYSLDRFWGNRVKLDRPAGGHPWCSR